MEINRLVLRGWRNWERCEAEFDARLNVVWGNNGQGKTNLLEAIYYLTHLNSFRSSSKKELIAWDQENCCVAGDLIARGIPKSVRVELGNDRRQTFVDNGKTSDLQKYFEGMCSVLFAPQHTDLVWGTPSSRRRFMDRVAFRKRKDHLSLVRNYLKVLRSRNIVLKEKKMDLLDAYSQRLAELGARLTAARLEVVSDLSERIPSVHRRLTGSNEKVALDYRSVWMNDQTGEIEELSGSLLEQLNVNRNLDLARGFTTKGPHSDDLDLRIDGRAARRFASQGQGRSLVLSLSVAQWLLLRASHGEGPVFLLDDLSSQLDDNRRRTVTDFLLSLDGQLFVTTTSPDGLPSNPERKDLKVVDGAVVLAD